MSCGKDYTDCKDRLKGPTGVDSPGKTIADVVDVDVLGVYLESASDLDDILSGDYKADDIISVVDFPMSERLGFEQTSHLMEEVLKSTGGNKFKTNRAQLDKMLNLFGNPEYPDDPDIIAPQFRGLAAGRLITGSIKMERILKAHPDDKMLRLRIAEADFEDLDTMGVTDNENRSVAFAFARMGLLKGKELSPDFLKLPAGRNGNVVAHTMAKQGENFDYLGGNDYADVLSTPGRYNSTVAQAIIQRTPHPNLPEPSIRYDEDRELRRKVWGAREDQTNQTVAHLAASKNMSVPHESMKWDDGNGMLVAHNVAKYRLEEVPKRHLLARDSEGNTPIHYAASYGKYTSDPSHYDVANNHGVTVADMIRASVTKEIGVSGEDKRDMRSIPVAGNMSSVPRERLLNNNWRNEDMEWSDMEGREIRLAYCRAVRMGNDQGFKSWRKAMDEAQPTFDQTGLRKWPNESVD